MAKIIILFRDGSEETFEHRVREGTNKVTTVRLEYGSYVIEDPYENKIVIPMDRVREIKEVPPFPDFKELEEFLSGSKIKIAS